MLGESFTFVAVRPITSCHPCRWRLAAQEFLCYVVLKAGFGRQWSFMLSTVPEVTGPVYFNQYIPCCKFTAPYYSVSFLTLPLTIWCRDQEYLHLRTILSSYKNVVHVDNRVLFGVQKSVLNMLLNRQGKQATYKHHTLQNSREEAETKE